MDRVSGSQSEENAVWGGQVGGGSSEGTCVERGMRVGDNCGNNCGVGYGDRNGVTRRELLGRMGSVGKAGLAGLMGMGLGGVMEGMAQGQGGWTLRRHEGRDYLSLREIGAFYKLGPLERSLNAFSLRIGNAGRGGAEGGGPGEGFGESRGGSSATVGNGAWSGEGAFGAFRGARASLAGVGLPTWMSLRGQTGSQEFFISRLKFILSYPIREIEGELCMSRMDLVKLVEPVLRPRAIRSAGRVETVVLDPGHGGSDSGAVGAGGVGVEKDYTLDVAYRARAALERAGYRVRMTRSGDEFVSLEERTQVANRCDPESSLFLSIHFNASGSGSGVETYALAPRGVPSMAADGPRVSDEVACPGNVRDAENMALATATHACVVMRTRLPDRGIKRARFFVIRETRIPSVLVEGGFVSNPQEVRRIGTGEYRQQMAVAMVEAVENYRRALMPS